MKAAGSRRGPGSMRTLQPDHRCPPAAWIGRALGRYAVSKALHTKLHTISVAMGFRIGAHKLLRHPPLTDVWLVGVAAVVVLMAVFSGGRGRGRVVPIIDMPFMQRTVFGVCMAGLLISSTCAGTFQSMSIVSGCTHNNSLGSHSLEGSVQGAQAR